METRKQRLNALRSALKRDRTSYEAFWRDLADFVLPSRAEFQITDRNRGDRRNQKIIDSTASFASRTLGSGMHSGMTNPARLWHRLTTEDPELAEFGPVKQWLHVVRQRMAAVFLRSNLYQVLPTVYEDMGTFATGTFALMEDDESVIRCYDFPIGSYYLSTDAKRRVRVFVHEYVLTVRQIVEKFGRLRNGTPDWSVFSDRVKNLWDKGSYEETIDVVQVIEPNADYDPSKIPAKYKLFRSCHYEMASQQDVYLEESGFDEFPILSGRWQLRGNSVYGVNSPGMMAIGDIRQLQLMEKRAAQGLDKMVNPPLVADPDLMTTALSQLPGGITYARDATGKAFRPLHEVNLRLDYLDAKQEQVRSRIDRAYYADLFLMLAQLDRKEITATEIYERKEEKLLALGPVLERCNQDVFDPLIDRTFAIMDRRGMLPEAPEELQGQPLKIEYESVMAQAQKAMGISGVERLAAFVSSLAEAKQDPSVFDKFDIDQAIDEVGEMAGVPPRLIVPDEDVAEIRAQRAQQQQQAAQAEMLKTAAAGAKDLSQADTTGKNALTDLLGGAAA